MWHSLHGIITSSDRYIDPAPVVLTVCRELIILLLDYSSSVLQHHNQFYLTSTSLITIPVLIYHERHNTIHVYLTKYNVILYSYSLCKQWIAIFVKN